MNEIDELRRNLDAEISMLRELSSFFDRAEYSGPSEKRIFLQVVDSLRKRIRMVNLSVGEVVKGISLAKKLPSSGEEKRDVEKIELKTGDVTLKTRDRSSFLKELDISEGLIKKLKKKRLIDEKPDVEFAKPTGYGRFANKFFFGMTSNWIKQGRFKSLGLNLRRSNYNILIATYLSMMMLSIFLSFFVGLLVFGFFMFFSVGLQYPFVSFFEGNYLTRFFTTFWIFILIPLLTWAAFYFFPGAEKRGLAKKIDQELPFVVIHMSSVSGSGIEPSQIFKIIGTSREYKYTKKEIRKVLNQINVYGYDLTTALRNVALATPSAKLAELLNGISITINSGGDMHSFFEKRAESLLLEYRLEREKFTKTAETFMDIYISVVIAAPMILLMLLVLISVSGIQTGFTINQLTVAIIGLVSIINILFLAFLHVKQPVY